MVRAGLIGINQHEKWCCEEETSYEVYICKKSELDNNQHHFVWYGKRTSIHELRKFGCNIYPITLSPKRLYDWKQEGSLMVYTIITETIKLWDKHTNNLKYCSSVKFDEHNNKFGKVWSPGSALMNGKDISSLPTLKLISHTTLSPNMIYLRQQ